jgi:hypothetical protein
MQQIADNIAEMRRIIERRGWCQGVLMDSSGQVCLLGARAVALGLTGRDGARPAELVLAGDPTIRFLTARARGSLPSLNDRAVDHGVIMEFLIEAQLAAMSGQVPSVMSGQAPSVEADQEPPDDAVMALLV